MGETPRYTDLSPEVEQSFTNMADFLMSEGGMKGALGEMTECLHKSGFNKGTNQRPFNTFLGMLLRESNTPHAAGSPLTETAIDQILNHKFL